ncbi:MAG: hypothetical protein R3C11_29140 [Planctomycetaceae bacterium]
MNWQLNFESRFSRRRFLQIGTGLSAATLLGEYSFADETAPDMSNVRRRTLSFIESMRITDGPYGQYRYSTSCEQATLYSSPMPP